MSGLHVYARKEAAPVVCEEGGRALPPSPPRQQGEGDVNGDRMARRSKGDL